MNSLIERGGEVTRLRLFTGRGRQRPDRAHSAVGVIGGPAGSGKSALLRDAIEDAEAQGITVLSALASPAERGLPYGVVDQLLPELRLVHCGPLRARIAVKRALSRTAGNGPVLLAVDDIHFADPRSVQCLLHAVRQDLTGRMSLLVTHTPGVLPASLALTRLLELADDMRLTLRPLSVLGVGRLLSERKIPGSVRRAPEVHARTGGSPRLAMAFLGEPGGAPGETAAGEPFQQAALDGVRRSGRDAVKTAHGLAVLGKEATVPLLAELLGLRPGRVRGALAALEGAGITEDTAFRHPAVRTAVLEALPVPERHRLRRRAAGLLHRTGADPVVVAAQLLDADPPPGRRPRWICRTLATAAELALERGQAELARRFLKAAEDRSREGERLQLTARRAQIAGWLNPGEAAAQLRALASPAGNGLLPAESALRLAPQLLRHGHLEEAARVMATARDAAGRSPGGDPIRSELAFAERLLAVTYPGVCPASASVAVPAAVRPADPRLPALAALAAALSPAGGQGVQADAERALEALGPADPSAVEVVEAALMALVCTDRPEQAAHWCERLLSQPEHLGSPACRAVVTAVKGLTALRRGRLDAAANAACSALELLPPHGWGVAIGLPLSVLVEARTGQGRHREASMALLAHPVPQAMYRTRYALHFLHARARHQLATGRAHAALADFMECDELMRRWRMDLAALLPWRAGAAEALLQSGSPQDASRFAAAELARPVAGGRRARGKALRVLAAAHQPERRREILEKALAEIRESGDLYETARILADLGEVYKRQGDQGKGWLLVRQALRTADRCGAEGLYHSLQPPASRDSAAAAGRPPAAARAAAQGAELTAAERRVASLAARGHTNREIAAKLYITVSTVEQHLTRVYRKVKVTRRQDLSGRLDLDVADTA
ncbi:LuxR C-terminal-related transcriptional regulator [Streptomyces orinoci]|uniref:LuxR C-terminal-related transcriptional regulator n=1 Tax=Streptomyces orinoci TaxID=67339 RepID=A0ABV3K3B2_STRON|nr:LuxR family transcriptional regulator [Streptomyces orinoci]